jgi:uncharacterized protein (DUF362 family)/Pyruvate/2-oxoacid:ferredoxin oxidoreductase delta subunit
VKVAVTKVDSYNETLVAQGISHALKQLGGINNFVSPGDRVLIKPNMLEGMPPAKATTTHPEVVRAVIRQVKSAGGLPIIGDSPGINGTKKVAEQCGILEICRQEDVELYEFQKTSEYAYPQGLTLKRFTLCDVLEKVDKVISVAKMKTHSFMGITGAVKNLFGLFVGTDKAQFHLRMKARHDFAGMLVDLTGLVKPVLSIVDGITGMEGNGPRNGQPRYAGIILAGANAFAVDLVMARIMGFEAEKMPVAARALAAGLAPRLEDIEVIGSGKSVKLEFKQPYTLESIEGRLPSRLVKLGQEQLTQKPQIANSCIGCARCAQHCPPDAIKIVNNRAVIDYQKCIRCYCCQELCPADAVKLKSGFLLKTVRKLTKH